jgi:hypothetical protein
MPMGVTVEPGQPVGPTLIIDATNRSDAERSIGYEFEAGGTSGGGEGTLLACERSVLPFGEIASSFSVMVDGHPVMEETLPPGIPPDRFVVVRVTIAEDGTATAAEPVLAARMPPVAGAPIPDCDRGSFFRQVPRWAAFRSHLARFRQIPQ